MNPRYPFPDLDTLPQDIRSRILEVQEKTGFIPHVFLTFARRPAEWRAFFAFHDALMLKESGSLSKGEREMIVTATSAANQYLYCVGAFHWSGKDSALGVWRLCSVCGPSSANAEVTVSDTSGSLT